MTSPAIAFHDVSRRFPRKGGEGEVAALEHVTLEVAPGTVQGIIGRSGAGKSTLLRLVNGLERPGEGRVIVNGHDVGLASGPALRAIRREVGMIFQHFNLLSSRTVAGNIALDKGLIRLADGTGLTPSPLDVTDNPRKLRFLELDAAQLPRALADADAAVINTNYALDAGLDPAGDAIAAEKPDSPYANVIVVRSADREAPWAATLVEAYHDPRIRAFIEERYHGAVIPAW